MKNRKNGPTHERSQPEHYITAKDKGGFTWSVLVAPIFCWYTSIAAVLDHLRERKNWGPLVLWHGPQNAKTSASASLCCCMLTTQRGSEWWSSNSDCRLFCFTSPFAFSFCKRRLPWDLSGVTLSLISTFSLLFFQELRSLLQLGLITGSF